MDDNRTFLKMHWWLWLGLVMLALAAVFLFHFLTPDGIGLVNDSVAYIGGARNLLAGEGYSRLTGDGSTRPITNYPPLFPILIALFSLLGWESITAAAVLNGLLLGINVVLLGVIVWRVTRLALLALLAGAALLFSAPLVGSHLFAMSEPLYLALSLVCILLLADGLERGRWWLVLLSGLAAGLAFVTRYVGVSLFLTAILAIGLWQPSWRSRLQTSAVFLLGGIPAPLIWLARNSLVTENVANRALLYHPIPQETIQEGLLNFWGWLLPEAGGLVERFWWVWGAIFVVGFLALTLWAIWCGLHFARAASSPSNGGLILWLMSALAVIYFTILVMTMLFLDASPIFEHRILAPFYLPLLVLFFGLLAWLINRQGWAGKTAAVMVVVALFLSFTEDALDGYSVYREGGQGFASPTWTESQTLAETKLLPEVTIFTNRQSVVYLLANRSAYILPSPINPATLLPREGYAEDLASIRRAVQDGRAVIVVFQYDQIIQDPQDRDWLDEVSAGLPIHRRTADGIIWGDLD